MGQPKPKSSEILELYRPKADKERNHDGRRIMPNLKAAEKLGPYGPKLSCRMPTRAVASAETEAVKQLGLYKPTAENQRRHGGREVGQAKAAMELGPKKSMAEKMLGHEGHMVDRSRGLRCS